MAGAVAQHGRHRREQHRRAFFRGAGRIGDAEIVDPGNFGIEPEHLAERIDNADQEHADDQRVKAGIGHEAVPDLLRLPIEDDGEQHGKDEKERHGQSKMQDSMWS